MTQSWQNVPHFYVTVAVDMSDVMRFNSQLDLSVNDFILAAAARALLDHPQVNSRWNDGEVELLEEINVAIAVATEKGLYSPVIRDCADLSVRGIGERARELAEKARQGRLKAEDMSDGTFTVSNMGMLGVESFTAIITPPQAAALAVGAVQHEPVVDGGQGDLAVIPRMRLTLSADHRALDGADAADFLNTVRDYLEVPIKLVAAQDDQ
jgi:pyruvate dehydrogenase E2 component (dihydrolipoamide acetyltransferase)